MHSLMRFVPMFLVLSFPLACLDSDFNGVEDAAIATMPREEAPTGAKVEINEYGEAVILDEECGGIDSLGYRDYFQSAMFRDAALGGPVSQPVLYAVDGAHLWRAAVSGTTVLEPQIWQRFVGRATAVQATTDAVIIGTIDGDIITYSHDGVRAAEEDIGDSILDMAVSSRYLVIAAGRSGLISLDLAALNAGNDAFRDQVEVDYFAAGIRFAGEITGDAGVSQFAYAACRTAGGVFVDPDGAFVNLGSTQDLIHHNAKDAVLGGGLHLAIANNGLGLWFMHVGDGPYDESFKQVLDLDPAFYANSVVLNQAQTQVYLAAGNQSLQMHAFDVPDPPPPPPPVRRDPIDVEYVWPVSTEARVVGLGNFRQVGERTILWADTGLQSVDEVRERGAGWLSAASAADASGEAGWLLSRPDATGFVTYFLPATAQSQPAHWRRLYGGLHVRLDDGLLTTTETSQPVISQYLFWQNQDGTSPVGLIAYGRGPSDSYERTLTVFEAPPELLTGPLSPWILYQDVPDALPGSLTPVDLGTVVPRSSMERSAPCGLAPAPRGPSFLERTGYGSVEHGDHYLVWCTRKDDPWVPGRVPERDSGTLLYACQTPKSLNALPVCERLAVLTESQIVQMWPAADGTYWALSDDRRAYAYSWLQLDADFRVVRRSVFAGRPLAWSRQGDLALWTDEQGIMRQLDLPTGAIVGWIGGVP